MLVLGGGPAGAAASRLLATWGHSVHLITRAPGADRLAVSVPPSCAKLFEAIGVSAAIERAGFLRSTGNTVWWEGPEARVEEFAGGARGWQVELDRFESVLLEEAARSGVTIERRLVLPDQSLPHAAFVLDCSGRSGILARSKGLRRMDDGPKTVALAGEWRGGTWDLPDPSHTLVESYADGWMWSVPARAGVRHVSAMIDPQRSALARGAPAREVYLAEVAKTRAFKRLLDAATLVEGPTGWDASTYRAHQYADDSWLLVGDAGSFIDPLSSAGVKKALASAWLAAVAVHTSMKTSSMRAHALRFYDAREREIEAHHRAESSAFLAQAARGHDRPFWTTRSDAHRAAGDGDDVAAAFGSLKAADEIRLVLAPGVGVEDHPLVDGHEIVLKPQVVGPNSSPTRYVGGVDMVVLLQLAPGTRQVPDLFDAYCRQAAPVALHDFLLALSTAVARRWLVSQ